MEMTKKSSTDKLTISRLELDKLFNEVNTQFQRDSKITLEGLSAQLMIACLNSISVVFDMLSKAGMRMDALRKLFEIELPKSNPVDADGGEKSGDGSIQENTGSDAPNQENTGSDAPNQENTGGDTASTQQDRTDNSENSSEGNSDKINDDHSKSAENSRSTHGPRQTKDFPDANHLECHVPDLKKGDECPADDCNGKLYSHQPVDSPRQLIVFNAQAPIAPTVYKLNDLQCNMCKTLFKAELPAKVTEQGIQRGSGRGYTHSCIAFLLVAHYYFGRSFRSMDQLSGMIGDRIADSTLNGKALEQRSFFGKLWKGLLTRVGDCPVLYGDDISSKVIPILPEIRKSRNGVYTCRNGIYTSIVTAITNEGKPIPIYTTGLHHLGETLDKILADRSPDLPKPVIVRDQSSSNKITTCETISAGCFQHARDYFVKARKNYPNECDEILAEMSKVFVIDRDTHAMSPAERLAELNNSALPIMEGILKTVNNLIDMKEAAPLSDMGVALDYFKKYYPTLMIPYQIPGIGLTNNLSEWMTYPVVRYLNNCRHYASEEGAEIGDYVVTLTMLALLAGRNPIKYIEYLLAQKVEIEAEGDFLDSHFPWNISLDKVPNLVNDWFTNWIPEPGQNDTPKERDQEILTG